MLCTLFFKICTVKALVRNIVKHEILGIFRVVKHAPNVSTFHTTSALYVQYELKLVQIRYVTISNAQYHNS